MTTKDAVLSALKRVKGPDMEGNVVDLGLVSDVFMRDGKAYFSITVPPARAQELEPLRQAAEKVVAEVDGISGVVAVLTAESGPGGSQPVPVSRGGSAAGAPSGAGSGLAGGAATGAASASAGAPEHPRVAAARAAGNKGAPPAPASAPASSAPPPSATAPAKASAAPPASAPAPGGPSQGNQAAGVPGVRHLIAVASGKGGVGKSTTAVNLALGFQAIGKSAGVLDADIYGPSQPRLLGLSGQPAALPDNRLRPMEAYGLKAMSMGFMVDEATPIIWRGPMVVSALNQMLRGVAWDDLDVLVIDMPPGTGDVQLTMAQQVPLSGAVVVSTPQDLALLDARKGLNMFRKVDVPVLGIIENMSYFICPSCGERSDIFGHGGAANEAEKLGVPFLGGIPLHMDIRATSDAGRPIVASAPDSEHAKVYKALAEKAWAEVEAGQGASRAAPALVME
ncbi:MAG: Mrp/NBP35 family ATP-binding protein [Pseudomonadota bacterium]